MRRGDAVKMRENRVFRENIGHWVGVRYRERLG